MPLVNCVLCMPAYIKLGFLWQFFHFITPKIGKITEIC